ncbi:MAG TPA: 50S ribosomal protein L25 [Anaerolineae bacterium]|nr:50S ribosomal protein L25 [Anaerolineae bacterium]
MENIIIKAKNRDLIGKKVKVLRKEGKLPAVIYGYKMTPTPITLDLRDATSILNKLSSSSIVSIDLEGKEHAALVREKQRDFIKGSLLHVDFQVVSLTEKAHTNVAIVLMGESPALKEYNALIVTGITEVEVESLPKDLPERITVDISGLTEIGDAIYLKDVSIPVNVDFLTNPEELIAVATAVKEEVIEEEEEELIEVEEELEEPEMIEHGQKEEDREKKEPE